ncbi:metal-sulfur cluster assembly factor [Limosilactobacillus portuensis]|jgi:metal-sulfur cluster biosynthetic enzyme|uniref:metal-sulfur cluster assembly factor n=1 Tax=Limosilactobacillus portuensis TaxID=2742601 RepID=UPI000C809276|nr:metal-sulfur cluster assembly factor [Limosilactobacillus portuensis]MDU1505771.1 metal-sulfur cluster assembly factor [Limosilactobacillus vaginalis]PMC27177.1 DNA methyltransferase [Gardnerella vaginalis]WCT61228.1 metal-sulfur cluster assembly factor [Limosilactobacillus portuensis]
MLDKEKLSPIEQEVLEKLQTVIDPELGIDLVNLGLIYDIEVNDQQCKITMTLTTMGCPISDLLYKMIKEAVLQVAEITKCEINLVWEPAWGPDKMSRFARMALGVHF